MAKFRHIWSHCQPGEQIYLLKNWKLNREKIVTVATKAIRFLSLSIVLVQVDLSSNLTSKALPHIVDIKILNYFLDGNNSGFDFDLLCSLDSNHWELIRHIPNPKISNRSASLSTNIKYLIFKTVYAY